ncbi:MAG: hypothetical protein GX025_01470 [Clostridiales bacterium]|nr:hypothetical protein [Clostridiales bacterium]
MRIYYADIRGADEENSLYPPLSPSRGSAFGTSLLAYAYGDFTGKAILPAIEKLAFGRPVFTKRPAPHFSISHCKTHIFCVVSKSPVGIDAEPLDRKVSSLSITRLTTAKEREALSFLETWTLRESYLKLTGEGDLRTLRFYREEGKIIPPSPEVFCKLYPDVDGCLAALCSKSKNFPETCTKVPIEKLLKKDKPLHCHPKDLRL